MVPGEVGGFGVSDNPAFERLRFTSRPYMFTASSSPSSVATALATLGKIKSPPGLRKQLWDNAQALYKGLSDLGFTVCAAANPLIAGQLQIGREWCRERRWKYGVIYVGQ